MKIFNSLTRKIEEFIPLEGNKVKVYTCGPTVYFYPHIGNWRTFALGDLIVRVLKYLGYKVHYVMNITDVGHLTGDNLGDADTGEDRLEKGARREGRTAWDIAKFYSDDFEKSYKKLNMTMPTLEDGKEGYCAATNHIKEQIEMVRRIEEKGFTYKISDGIYFNVGAYEKAGNIYGRMSNIHKDNVEARVAENKEKKDQRDFALWKFSPKNEKRQMEWDSPWGVGFPGWHIECSAMSIKYLGDQFDVHIGGEDHKSTHHPNEIAQAEAVTGKKPFVKYWMHGAFLQVNEGRMGKSLGNAYTLADIEKHGYEPEHLRYFYLTGHYRQPLNFTWQNLKDSRRTYNKLVNKFINLKTGNEDRSPMSTASRRLEDDTRTKDWEERFRQTLGNDLNTPELLALVWEMIKSEELNDNEKRALLTKWDEVLGLNIGEKAKMMGEEVRVIKSKTDMVIETSVELSEEVMDLIEEREIARKARNFVKADEMRDRLKEMGYEIKDRKGKVIVEKIYKNL